MAKRMTATEKWDDPWFFNLSNEHKLLWLYILDKCDHAGIFQLNKKMADFCLNNKFDWDNVYDIFNSRIIIINDEKWFIPKFVKFQYGELNPDNRAHNSVITILKKEGVYKRLTSPLVGYKDKAKDKAKDKDKDIENNKEIVKEMVDQIVKKPNKKDESFFIDLLKQHSINGDYAYKLVNRIGLEMIAKQICLYHYFKENGKKIDSPIGFLRTLLEHPDKYPEPEAFWDYKKQKAQFLLNSKDQNLQMWGAYL